MESDKNPFPHFDLLPGIPVLRQIGRVAGRVLRFLPERAPDFMSTHNYGAGPMLDRELYDQQEFDYGRNE